MTDWHTLWAIANTHNIIVNAKKLKERKEFLKALEPFGKEQPWPSETSLIEARRVYIKYGGEK